jgi:toxin ParE1/3/4
LIPYEFHFEAEEELAETAVFYESRVIGLGASFTSEVQRTVNLIREYPHSGLLLGQKVRRVLVRRFPYGSEIQELKVIFDRYQFIA